MQKKNLVLLLEDVQILILKDRKDITTVFIYSNMEDKIKRATTFYGLNKEMLKKK